MKIRAKILLKNGSTHYREVSYNKPYVKMEIDGMMRILQPRYFYQEKGETILEMREHVKTKDIPQWNT